MLIRFMLLVFAVGASISPTLAQTGKPPASYTECDALYTRELKKAADTTSKDLRETQRLAGLQRMRCDRAVERKLIMDRAKGANRPGGR
jgi:hypothetical protein